MAVDRIEALKNILALNPADALARYGLAMEHVRAGSYELAVTEFRSLLAASPDHAYAYFHAGQTMEKLGRVDEARELYAQGVAAAVRQGNTHARDQIQAALDHLAAA